MAHASHAEDRAEQVRILQEKAVVVSLRGATAEAEHISAEAQRLCESLGDAGRSLLPGVMWCRGTLLLHARHHDEAARVLRDGKRIAQDAGQERLGAWIDQVSARVALAAGDLAAGERYATAGMAVFIRLRNSYGTAHCQYRLGQIHLRRRRVDEAVWSLREALESFHNCDDTWMETEASLDLADAYRYRGQVQDAIRLQRIARRTYGQLGGRSRARQATWVLLRTLFTAVLRQRPGAAKDTGSRPELD
jgi:tetratricopeptide (TPR) repeat protein